MKLRIFAIVVMLATLAFVGCGDLNDNLGGVIDGSYVHTYSVGDYYKSNGKKGVVFWVDETGQHGKILSLKNSETVLQWSYDNTESTIGAGDYDDGASNTESAMLSSKVLGYKYPAFSWCAALGDGWYLPACNELLEIAEESVLDTVNQTLRSKRGDEIFGRYWSSTEDGKYNAYAIMVNDGSRYSGSKSFFYNVRAVAVF